MSRRRIRVTVVGNALALLLPDVAIAQGAAGKTAQGLDYVSGGISLDEREALDARRSDYALQIVIAAKKSGAFLSDAQVAITDQAGGRILATTMDGPWLRVGL